MDQIKELNNWIARQRLPPKNESWYSKLFRFSLHSVIQILVFGMLIICCLSANGQTNNFAVALPTRHIPQYDQVLGIKFDATQAEIKTVFKKKVQTMHPDKIPNISKAKEADYTELQIAHKILSNPMLRCVYHCDEFRKYGFTMKQKMWDIVCRWGIEIQREEDSPLTEMFWQTAFMGDSSMRA